ncbi:MAG TPA: class I SAM-dependent methyltransferase [Candidatus Desulfofervidus auxilii]|uniref:Class I SAM-dependent methyltransferase n=1 Tax=Desulfofervidus auxilii TaxID=1621989 RepID=A0A7C0U3L5_DESA2|nr:class I SAM-dependent methyltransferase [Candidatus Desulfofervidus auxilii]
MKAKIRYANTFMDTTPRRIEECDARQLEVLKIFSRYKFNRILDVGCADGNFSILLKEACNAREVYGIKVSEKGVKLTRKNGVKAFQLDIDEEDFPFEDNYFDAVFAGSVIEYLSDPDHLLEEVRRVLKLKDLGLFITLPNLASLYNKILLLLGFQPFGMNISLKYRVGKFGRSGETVLPGAGNIRYFTLRSLKELQISIYECWSDPS